jgi:hypothetical protein
MRVLAAEEIGQLPNQIEELVWVLNASPVKERKMIAKIPGPVQQIIVIMGSELGQ